MVRGILKKLRTSLVLITVIGLCCLGAFAVSRQWEGLSAIAYYLIAIIALPPAVIEVFPGTIHHVHRIVRAVSPLPFNTTGAFRDALIHKLRWINTTNNISYHGLTGTYSFNGGDTAGATGVTISQFLLGSGSGGRWVAVNEPVAY